MGNWGWVADLQQQSCHLTCAAESLPVLSFPVPTAIMQCSNPFCGHKRDGHQGVRLVCSEKCKCCLLEGEHSPFWILL